MIKNAKLKFENLNKNDIFKYKNSYYRKMSATHAAWIIDGVEYRKCETIPATVEVELALRLAEYLPLEKTISS